MMETDVKRHCANCGHVWHPKQQIGADRSPAAMSAVCPVCSFRVAALEPAGECLTSVSEFEARLGALVGEAFAGGLSPNDIVRVVQDELEFAAEMAHSGRRMYVQVVDLGPQESTAFARPVRDRSAVLRSHVVGG